MAEMISTYQLNEEMERLLELAEKQELDEDDARTLAQIIDLDTQLSGDLQQDAILIRSCDFPEYAEQFAHDIGAISDDYSWPNCHIDWEAAASSLAMDYFEVQYAGETYLTRGF